MIHDNHVHARNNRRADLTDMSIVLARNGATTMPLRLQPHIETRVDNAPSCFARVRAKHMRDLALHLAVVLARVSDDHRLADFEL